MPHIHLAALGGTIASTGQAGGGVAPQVSAADIASAADAQSLPVDLTITFEQIAQVSSGQISLDNVRAVVASARRAAASGADALVLTQGTDTLEETSFALSLLNDSGIPIVATGAMRGASQPGADGPANVRAALVVAADLRLAALPAVLLFADELHDPSAVRKVHASQVSAFSSGPALGPLGWVSEDELTLVHVPVAAPPRLGAGRGEQPRVALIEVSIEDNLELLRALPAAGFSAAVLAGVGGGHVRAEALEAVSWLVERMPVILASRTGSGRTLERTYGYPGGDIDLRQLGLISAGRLDARKARIAAILGLHAGLALPEVFAAWR